jgi:hypothetical protein
MIRTVFIVCAFLSPLLFPFPLTVVFVFIASVFLPPVGLMIGALIDALYYTPGASFWPLGIVLGITFTVLGTLVRRFIKARIISA